MAELVLVTGGVRSGKSAVAESLVAGAGTVVYVATGRASDAEMAGRIAGHRARRPPSWQTVETLDPVAALRDAPRGSAVLLDALGLWLAARPDADVGAFCAAAAAHEGGPVVVVAEQAGLGLVPLDAPTRRWLDRLGEATRRLSEAAARTLFVVAGNVIEWSSTAPAHGDRMVPPGALDFAVNVHGAGPPPHLRTVLTKAIEDAGRYPDETAARAAVAARHGRPADEVLVTAGAADALHLIARVVGVGRACIVHPTFTGADAALAAAGIPAGHAYRRAVDGWRLDPEAVPADAELVVLGNPNNPTGGLDDPARVAALCRPGRLTVVDEAFMDFVEDDDRWSLAARRGLPGLVVVRSVTKLWALPGIRAGYLLGPPGLVKRCAAARPPWATSGPALAAVEACARDEPYRRRVAREVANARAALTVVLRALPGVEVADAAANFLLLRVPDGPAVHEALLADGVAVRPSTFPGLDRDHLRVAVRDDAANALLVKALAKAL